MVASGSPIGHIMDMWSSLEACLSLCWGRAKWGHVPGKELGCAGFSPDASAPQGKDQEWDRAKSTKAHTCRAMEDEEGRGLCTYTLLNSYFNNNNNNLSLLLVSSANYGGETMTYWGMDSDPLVSTSCYVRKKESLNQAFAAGKNIFFLNFVALEAS